MGWNRAANNSVADSQRNGKPNHPIIILIGLLCAGLAVVLCILLFAHNDADERPQTAAKSPAKTLLEPGDKVKATTTAVENKPSTPLTPEEIAKGKARAEKREALKRRQAKLVELNKKKRPSRPYEIFNHPCENRIAELLMTEPGTPFFMPPHFSERFVKDFQESCKEPIIIKNDDSDYVKRLKQDMIDCKIDLCNRMANGENLSEILSETHLELQKLGQLKAEIMRMTREEIRANAKSANEADDLFDAANKLLETKGIAPMKDNSILRNSFRRMAERNASRLK